MATPADRVLGVAELLTMVILALPQSAILVLQRVNKEWQSIVDTTPAIQQKLFLQPSTDTIIWEGYSPFKIRAQGQHPMIGILDDRRQFEVPIHCQKRVLYDDIRHVPQIWMQSEDYALRVVKVLTRENGLRFDDLLTEIVTFMNEPGFSCGQITFETMDGVKLWDWNSSFGLTD